MERLVTLKMVPAHAVLDILVKNVNIIAIMVGLVIIANRFVSAVKIMLLVVILLPENVCVNQAGKESNVKHGAHLESMVQVVIWIVIVKIIVRVIPRQETVFVLVDGKALIATNHVTKVFMELTAKRCVLSHLIT